MLLNYWSGDNPIYMTSIPKEFKEFNKKGSNPSTFDFIS